MSEVRLTDFRRRQRYRIELLDLVADMGFPEGHVDHRRFDSVIEEMADLWLSAWIT
jgi:hypothetical protein